MAFDPDAFLSGAAPAPKKRKAFDPDAFLAGPAPATAEPPKAEPPRSDTKPALPGPKTTALGAFGRAFAQSGSFGSVDELGGVGTAIGEGFGRFFGEGAESVPFVGKMAKDAKPAAPKPSLTQVYREGRDEHREKDAVAKKEHGGAYLGGEIVGSLATIPFGGAGGGAVKTIGRGIAHGAAQGAGSSEADLTKGETGKFLRDTRNAAALGGAVAAGGEAVRGTYRAVSKLATGGGEGLTRRVLNEIAEGTATATDTARKRLDKAGKAIVAEVTKGPDAKAVRGAYSGGSAIKGRETLAKIIKPVSQERDAAYAAFSKAGRDVVDVGGYQNMLAAAAMAARKTGKSAVADGIDAFSAKVADEAGKTGGLTLVQLRGLTTEYQNYAASALGALNEHARAKVLKQIAAPVTGAMDKTLSVAARGSDELQRAAATIRKVNPRLNALLTIDQALQRRAHKEATGKSALVRGAEKVATLAAGGAALGALTSEDKFKGAVRGAVIGGGLKYGIPAAAKAIDRSMTSSAIRAASGSAPGGRLDMERWLRAAGRAGTGAVIGRKDEDE